MTFNADRIPARMRGFIAAEPGPDSAQVLLLQFTGRLKRKRRAGRCWGDKAEGGCSRCRLLLLDQLESECARLQRAEGEPFRRRAACQCSRCRL